MADTLNVGRHLAYSSGYYEATVSNDGGVIIETKFHDTPQKHTVSVSRERWDRLVAWIEWQRQDRIVNAN